MIDYDLMRNVMLQCGMHDFSNGGMWSTNIRVAGKTQREINYYVNMLSEKGYLKLVHKGLSINSSYRISDITQEGYNFLQSIYDEGTWKDLLPKLKEMGFKAFELFL